MQKTNSIIPAQEPMAGHSHLICWKSIISGTLIAFMGFMVLTALGGGIGGFSAEGFISREEGGSTLASAAGLWLGLSMVISLFCGSYFALRVSRYQTHKIGAAHGFVIASIFFIAMMFGAGNMIGGMAHGLGKLAQGAGDTATGLSNNPAVQDAVNSAIGTANLKSPPAEVAQGLAVRLLQGDIESAKKYYAYQSGLASSEVDAKIAKLKSDFDAAVKTAGEKTAHAVGDAGWSLFVLFVAGLIGAVFGGRTGAHSNNERPFAVAVNRTDSGGFQTLRSQQGSVMPYVLGWFLGVPVSILFLIAMLRTIF